MKKMSKSIFRMLSEPIFEAIEDHDLTPDQSTEVIETLLGKGQESLIYALKQNSPEMLERNRQNTSAFEERNYERWREPLDLLTMLWVCCEELAENHAHEGPYDGDTLVFDSLAHLQPRALLVANEIICLLKGGFADGALTRWRSLHEIVVTAMFIAKHGHDAALGYRLSMWFANARAAKQYNGHASRAELMPFDAQELDEIESMRAKAEKQLGKVLKNDWDWSADILGKKKPNFSDVERDVGMDHWRPRFRWACQHIHAGFMRPDKLLGMSEAERFAFQVGPSNSGLVDPIHMTAISLMQITTGFLFFPQPNADRVIFARVLQALADEIGNIALLTQERTMNNAREGA